MWAAAKNQPSAKAGMIRCDDGAGTRGGQPPEVDGEEQDHHQADPERGEREPEQREDLPDAVPPAVDAHGGEDAGGNPDQERQGHGGRGEHERVGQAREVELEDGRPVVEGLAEVAAHERRDEVPVLDEQGAVEAELLADLLEVGLARAGLDEEDRRIARHADEEEDGEREQHERDHGVTEPPDDVFAHVRLPGMASSAGAPPLLERPAWRSGNGGSSAFPHGLQATAKWAAWPPGLREYLIIAESSSPVRRAEAPRCVRDRSRRCPRVPGNDGPCQ